MCSDCEEHEPECGYCGLTCYGECDDPDKCPTCWFEEYFGDYDPEPCIERDDGVVCECRCHVEVDSETLEDLLSDMGGGVYEQMKEDMSDKLNPKLQPGVFPFQKLPGELRDKIYGIHLKQYGNRRESPYYKGIIETALLSTCRQINKEARHLPLSINTLSFISPFQAYRFIGFKLLSSQKHLVKSIHVDVHGIVDFHGVFVHYLVAELGKLMLSHLSITLQGRIEAEWFTESKCFETCLLGLKGLASFDLIIGSGVIKDVTKGKIVDALRKKLLQAPETAKNPLKRKVSADPTKNTVVPAPGTQKVAKGSSTAKARKTAGRNVKTKKPTLSIVTTGPDPELVTGLTKKYDRLDEYARTFDSEATSVKIRLGRAYEAAREGKDKDFETLAEDILGTLEAHFERIVAARTLAPYQLSPPPQ